MLDSNNSNNPNRSALPMAALDDIPQPNANAKDIVALVKDHGRVSGYKLSDGAIVDKEQGVQLAKSGCINGVGIAHRQGTEYLKSLPDNTESNNLSCLPAISADEIE